MARCSVYRVRENEIKRKFTLEEPLICVWASSLLLVTSDIHGSAIVYRWKAEGEIVQVATEQFGDVPFGVYQSTLDELAFVFTREMCVEELTQYQQRGN